MDGFVYQYKKWDTKVRNEVPFPELALGSNNSKAMVSGKSPTKSAKDLSRHLNCVVGWINGPDE